MALKRGKTTRKKTTTRKKSSRKKPSSKKSSSKKDACYHKAKRKFKVFPSAYASGYIARCRKRRGKIK